MWDGVSIERTPLHRQTCSLSDSTMSLSKQPCSGFGHDFGPCLCRHGIDSDRHYVCCHDFCHCLDLSKESVESVHDLHRRSINEKNGRKRTKRRRTLMFLTVEEEPQWLVWLISFSSSLPLLLALTLVLQTRLVVVYHISPPTSMSQQRFWIDFWWHWSSHIAMTRYQYQSYRIVWLEQFFHVRRR